MILLLMYHNVDHRCSDQFIVSPSQFARQLRLIKAFGYRSITVSEVPRMLADVKPHSPVVVITFDDGYEDNYHFALPLLKQYSMKATVFPLASWVGKVNEWDRDKRQRQFRHMGWDKLREWSREGMEVGSHGMNHRRLSIAGSEKCLEHEILGSKRLLEEKLQQEIYTFSYPWGDFDNGIKALVRKAGYKAAVAGAPVSPKSDLDEYALPRWEVYSRLYILKFGIRFFPWFKKHGG